MEVDKDIWTSPWGIKRMAEMKEEQEKSKGVGDTVEKFTKLTGIKKLVEIIYEDSGKDCGCNKRKDKLNKIFPYKK